MSDEDIDRIFHALADRTRRDIVTRVMRREHTVSALAASYSMSFAAVQKHVAVLQRASLVTKQRRGREQLVQGNMDAIRKATRLLEKYEEFWQQRSRAIDELLAEEMGRKGNARNQF